MIRSTNNKGFSLVELMVVVAIIGILSAVAIPQINKYMARARQTEAKINLAALYTSNKAFYSEYNIYDNQFDVIGFRPEGKLRYNTGWNAAGTQCTLPNYGYTGNTGSTKINAKDHCAASGICTLLTDGDQTLSGDTLVCTASFTAAAAGKISAGSTIDRWTITETKVLTNSTDGTQ